MESPAHARTPLSCLQDGMPRDDMERDRPAGRVVRLGSADAGHKPSIRADQLCYEGLMELKLKLKLMPEDVP